MNAACLMLAMKIVGTVGGLKDPLTERAGDVFESRWIHCLPERSAQQAGGKIPNSWLLAQAVTYLTAPLKGHG